MDRTVRTVRPSIELALTETRRRHNFASYTDALLTWDTEHRSLRWMALETRALTCNTTLWPDGYLPGYKTVGRWRDEAKAARKAVSAA